MSGDADEPPVASGLDALRQGWRLIQMAPIPRQQHGRELSTDYLKYEFLFEKIVRVSAPKRGASHA